MYKRIINFTRPVSRHPKMSALDRAAQFSAFAALVGLDEQIDETARLVGSKIELSEDDKERLNRKLLFLFLKVSENDEHPEIRAIYFVPDQRKDGGSYVAKIGAVKKIDDVFYRILFVDGTEICILNLLDFEIMD